MRDTALPPLASQNTGLRRKISNVLYQRRTLTLFLVLVPPLGVTTETFDLFISTDVFIYIGELESVFAAVAKRAAKDGYFIFSVESCNIDQDYVLRPSGRYAQSQAYIATLAETHGFTIELCQSTGIRKEEGLWIMGHVYILKYVKDEPFPLWQWASGPIPVRVGAQLAY